MPMQRYLPVVMLLACGAVGCRSMGNSKWASTVTPGHGKTTLGLDYERAAPSTRNYEVPNFHVEYRVPLTSSWDLGFRFRGLDAAAGVRRQLVRNEDVELSAGTNASIGVPLGSIATGAGGYAAALEAPLRVGINVSSKSQLAFGAAPKLRFTREIRESRSLLATSTTRFEKSGPSYSCDFVVAFDVGLSNKVHLVPYVSAEVFYGSSSFVWVTDTVLLRGGIDVSF